MTKAHYSDFCDYGHRRIEFLYHLIYPFSRLNDQRYMPLSNTQVEVEVVRICQELVSDELRE